MYSTIISVKSYLVWRYVSSGPDKVSKAIQLVTPSSSAEALSAALSQNPHLTSLPHPKADVIAPIDITHTSGTADLLRSPELQVKITGDFLIIPCDLFCELPGEALLESWIIRQRPLSMRPQSLGQINPLESTQESVRCGGVGLWFDTKGEDYVKGAESDMIIITPDAKPIIRPPTKSLRSHISKLLYASSMDTLRDTLQDKGGLPLRTGLLRKHRKIKILTSHRAAHVYVFPYWMLNVIAKNEKFDSISEDAIGWWAKASWQNGLAEKLRMEEAFLDSMQSKKHLRHGTSTGVNAGANHNPPDKVTIPSILAYLHPSASPYLIRRVDTSALLLSTSLYLAAQPPLHEAKPSSHFAHEAKIATDASLIAERTTIHAQSTLVGSNTTIATHCTIKSSCVGASCTIAEGVKITGSLLMDGVKVETKASLQGCILGRRCVIGKNTNLDGCEVQDGFKVDDGTVGTKGQKFCVFEGLENGLNSMQDDETSDEQ